jgi:saccharopine dehydrogenase (NAD+, L-lysine-forming)
MVQRLLGYAVIRNLAAKQIGRRVAGPSPQTRAATGVEVWGEVRDADGNTRTGTLVGPNGYDLTADALVRAVHHVLAGTVVPGAHTPSSALGANFVRELTGVSVLCCS